MQVNGPVNAGNADIELEITNSKEDYGVQINDMALLSALSCSVIVSPDQNKGEYILAGNARIFTGAITVKDTGGTYLGTITVEQGMLDYGITRYTLALNENDELVFIVSSNITDELDYVLLYKNDTLVLAKDSVMGVTLSTESEYDQLVVIDKGVAGKIEIGAGGVASVEAGGHLFVSDQDKNGFLRFDYNAGDSTVISGVNSNGEYFCVENDLLENVCGDIVNVTGKVLIRNYNGYTDDITWTHRGVLTMRDGAELTGTGEGGYYSFHEASIHDFVMKKAVECYFYEGATVRNTEWNDCNVTVYDNAFVRQSVFNTRVYLNGGTLSDVTFNSEAYINSYILVEGDLYFKYTPVYELWRTPFFDMNGHTAVFDYSGRDENDEGMIYLDAFSEDVVFQLNLNRDQVVGKYAVVSDLTQNKEGDTPGARRGFVDTYNICVDGIIVGTIDDHNPEFVSGNYVYTMTCENDTELYLTIDISDDMDETYNVLWYDADQMYHSASVSGMTIGTDNCQQVVVRNNGVLGGARIVDGGTLKVCAGGQAVDLLLEKNGNLRLNYTEDDATVVAGTNQYGRFFVRNNEIGNLSGENVTVSGNVSMHDYHGIGTLRTSKGVSIDGTFDGGNYKLRDTFLNDFTLESAMKFDFYSGTVSNAVFNGGNDVQLHGGTISDTVFNTRVNFELGLTTLANVVINNGFTLPVNCPVVIELAGDLTLNSEGGFGNNTGINVNGHTVNVNYQDRTVNDNGMFSLCCFSEDTNFRLLFREDQKVGTYTLAEDAGSLIDYFLLNIGGVDTEVLSAENREMDYGGYHYTLAHDVITQKITLTIDVSETDDVSFSVSYKDATEEKLYHSASVDGLVFDQDNYHDLVVKDHGIVMNSELGDGGLMTVESGGKVIILEQKEGSKLRFDYEEGDTTVISGMNQYGAFFVKNNRLENVYGESISVKGDVLIRNYHSFSKREMYSYYVQGGTLRTQDGVSISGILEGENGTFEFSGSTVCDLVATGTSSSYYFNDGTSISRSVINAEGKCTVDADAGCIEDTVFNKGAEAETIFLHGGTYSDVVINGDWSIGVIMYYFSYKLVDNNFCMDGDLTLRGGYVFADQDEQWKHGVIDANGNTITLDLTDRTVIDNAMLDIDRVYDAELRVVLEQTKAIGTFKLGAYASKIGQKESVYNEYTNEREYKMVGDLDGVISVYDGNGIELAACTINGDTEYYGRYNYTVFVDDEGYLKLKVGWNNRDQVYSADEQESNDTRETATVISGNGTGVLPALTIHDSMDVDWFMFTLDSPGRKSNYIGIDFKQWAGDLDINLYDSNGELIDYARSVTDNERLSLSGHTAGTYYLKVSGYNGNRNSYRLVYNLPEPVELEDDYENGDSKETPYFLSRLEEKITLNGSISRSGDQDYYMFVMSERGLVSDTITLAYDDEFGDLDLYLYDQNGTTLLVSSKNTSGGQECITMAGLQYGLYYAAVKSKNGSVGRYELVFDVNDREVNPDKYESNDSMKKATKLYTLNGEKALSGLSIHSDTDVDYYRFSILEKGSADDCITLTCPARLGDLDIEILNADGEVAAYSRTAEDEDTVSLNGLDIGEYYIRVYGGTDVVNNYTLNWHVTNSSLIPSDTYEGNEPILIREDQTISGLSIAKVREEDETREDTFKIVLEYNAWKRSKIILTDYRSDWEDGMAYVIKDADGNVLKEGVDSEISLYGLKKGEYYLTLDAPNEDKYSEYSLIAQSLPDSDNAKDNT